MRSWRENLARYAPWSGRRARVLWSLPLVLMVLLWLFGMAASEVTEHPTYHTFGDVLDRIFVDRPTYPGYQDYWLDPHGLEFDLGYPLLLGALWCGCLYRWSFKRTRVAIGLVAWLGPFWFLLVKPGLASELWRGPVRVGHAFFGSLDGESYQEWGMQSSALFGIWFWLLLGVVVVEVLARDKPRAGCTGCGYDTRGLIGEVCPECGARLVA